MNCVVADQAWTDKVGELSIAAARAVWSSSPRAGGTSKHEVLYELARRCSAWVRAGARVEDRNVVASALRWQTYPQPLWIAVGHGIRPIKLARRYDWYDSPHHRPRDRNLGRIPKQLPEQFRS